MRPNLLTLIEDGLRRPDEIAFAHWRGVRLERLTYGQLARLSAQFADELGARGIAKGERVIFWATNSPNWVAAFFGCLACGVVAVPLDPHSTPEFVRKVQQQVAAGLVLLDSAADPATRAATDAAGTLGLPVIYLDELPEVVSGRRMTLPEPGSIDKDDLIEIIFTSGTTAEPKGVRLTHENFLANLRPIEIEMQKYLRYERFVHPIRFLCIVPLSHIFGQLMGVMIPMLLGGEVFYRRSLNPSDLITAIRRERISVLILVPRMLASLAETIRREYVGRGMGENLDQRLDRAADQPGLRRWWTFRDLHSRFGWKFWAFITGGADLDPMTEGFWRRIGYAVLQGYGMTETASLISIPHPFKMVNRSIGKALPGQQVRLDASGEILIRGSNVTSGYWSGASLHPIDDEGWLHTGDLGEMDADGNIYFRGRKKDVINLASGLKVFPEDLETALVAQPEIRYASVIRVQGRNGPEPHAVVILRDRSADAAAIIERANSTLAEPQHIRRWSIWPDEDFPRTPTTQKVLKRVIAGKIGDIESAAGDSAQTWSGTGDDKQFLRDQIARISGHAPTELDEQGTLAADLRLDSLGRVELLSALEERYRISLDEAAIQATTTVADLRRIVHTGNAEGARYPDASWARRRPVTWLRRAVLTGVVVPFERILSRSRVTGREYLRDLTGPVIFVSNHITSIDAGLILAVLPMRIRHHLTIAMLGEMLRDWRFPSPDAGLVRGIYLRLKYTLVTALFHVFPLPQQSGYRRSFAYAGESLERGDSVLIFPEGRRTTTGEMNTFLAGTGLLIAQARVPVVPVKIEGLFELKQKRRWGAPRGRVVIKFGEAVTFAADQSAAGITNELERRIREM